MLWLNSELSCQIDVVRESCNSIDANQVGQELPIWKIENGWMGHVEIAESCAPEDCADCNERDRAQVETRLDGCLATNREPGDSNRHERSGTQDDDEY